MALLIYPSIHELARPPARPKISRRLPSSPSFPSRPSRGSVGYFVRRLSATGPPGPGLPRRRLVRCICAGRARCTCLHIYMYIYIDICTRATGVLSADKPTLSARFVFYQHSGQWRQDYTRCVRDSSSDATRRDAVTKSPPAAKLGEMNGIRPVPSNCNTSSERVVVTRSIRRTF